MPAFQDISCPQQQQGQEIVDGTKPSIVLGSGHRSFCGAQPEGKPEGKPKARS